jgi:hypothetical protein
LRIELRKFTRHSHPERLPPATWLFPLASSLLACFREFDLDRVHGGFGGNDTQKRAGLGLTSEFAFPLVMDVGRPPID